MAELGGTRIIKFEEKPLIKVPVGMGIMAVEGKGLKRLRALWHEGEPLDLMAHLLPHLIEEGMEVRAYVTDAFLVRRRELGEVRKTG